MHTTHRTLYVWSAGPSSFTRFAALMMVGAALSLCADQAGRAQPTGPLTPADRSFVERLSFARARANLYDQVEGLPLKTDLTVGKWAMQDVTRHREFRLWVRTRPRYGGARVYSDATCDVDVRLAADELATQLVTLAEQHPRGQGPALATADIMKAARKWPVLWGTGSAALTEKVRTRKPTGWEDITFEGIQLARRAAAADAIHALLEQAGRLKVTPARRLHEFFESDDDVFEAVYEAVTDAASTVVENALDQVAVAQARLGMTELIHILTDVHQKHYHGDLFHAPDFREMALSARQSELRAQGLATPPNRYRQREPYVLIELDTPPWAATSLGATGRYDPNDDEDFSREVRRELARFDGMDALRKKVEALLIKDRVTVEQLLGYRRELKDDVVIFLSRARVVGRPHTEPDGTLTVRVELPLERLWKIVRRGMQRVEVDPSEDEATGNRPAQGVPP
ncbi:MAG: hypothetical protein ACE5I3_13075 [Phycisphaerae bacterium]